MTTRVLDQCFGGRNATVYLAASDAKAERFASDVQDVLRRDHSLPAAWFDAAQPPHSADLVLSISVTDSPRFPPSGRVLRCGTARSLDHPVRRGEAVVGELALSAGEERGCPPGRLCVGLPPARSAVLEPEHYPDDGSGEELAHERVAKVAAFTARSGQMPRRSPVNRPIRAMVELVRTCNLRCPVCPIGFGAAQWYPTMKLDVFHRAVASVADTVSRVTLYNYGEPFLCRDLHRFVGTVRELGIDRVDVTSNFSLRRIPHIDHVITAGLTDLRVSIDGITQDVYQQYRVGGRLDWVVENVRAVLHARERARSATPRLEAQLVVNRFNEHQVAAFPGWARDLGFDSVRIKTFNAFMSGPTSGELGRSYLPVNGRYSRYVPDHDGGLVVRDVFRLSRCRWPWDHLVINADGTAVPCCYDFNGTHKVGAVADVDLWDTPARRAFRARLRRDPAGIGMCSVCPVGIPALSVPEDGD